MAAVFVSRKLPVLLTTSYESEQLPPDLRHCLACASPSTKGTCDVCLSRLTNSRSIENGSDTRVCDAALAYSCPIGQGEDQADRHVLLELLGQRARAGRRRRASLDGGLLCRAGKGGSGTTVCWPLGTCGERHRRDPASDPCRFSAVLHPRPPSQVAARAYSQKPRRVSNRLSIPGSELGPRRRHPAFFNSISHKSMMRSLEHRIGDSPLFAAPNSPSKSHLASARTKKVPGELCQDSGLGSAARFIRQTLWCGEP